MAAENQFLVVSSQDDDGIDHFIEGETRLEIIKKLYAGQTLHSICKELRIKREAIDAEVRTSQRFKAAFQWALEACGDVMAETALATVVAAKETKGDIEERKLALRQAIEEAKMLTWMADRTSLMYQRRASKDAAKRPPRAFESNVPAAEIPESS